MATVTGLTKDRMLDIEAQSIVSGLVDPSGNLILTNHAGVSQNAGMVKGGIGDVGPQGPQGPQGKEGLPAGSVIAWASGTIPNGWLEANGQAVSRSTYSDLFAIIGVLYGSGNGSTTFNVPDLRGRVVVGQDTSQTEFDSLNEFGGAKTHLLTVAEMPSHTHIQNAHEHYAGHENDSLGGNWGPAGGSQRNMFSGATHGRNAVTTSSTATNQNTGGGGAHNNLQPYRVLKYIIKAIGEIGTLSSTVESVLLGRMATAELDIAAIQTAPAFQASLTSSQTLSGGSLDTKINFTTEVVDRGNCYNPTLARFTAPIDGTYEFNFSVTPSTNSGGPGFFFKINNVNQPIAAMGYGVAYNTIGATRIFDLVAGDYVEVWFVNFNSSTVTLHSSYGGLFSGKMI